MGYDIGAEGYIFAWRGCLRFGGPLYWFSWVWGSLLSNDVPHSSRILVEV